MKFETLLLIALIQLMGVPATARIGTDRDGSVKLPTLSEIATVSVSGGTPAYYTERGLLESISRMKPTLNGYATKLPFQRGIITLKNGQVLHWISAAHGALMLIDEVNNIERLYVDPNSSAAKNSVIRFAK